MTICFWLILFTALVYGLLHSLLASLKTKAIARNWFGSSTDRWFRLAYNLIAAVTLLPILVLPVVMPDKEIYTIHFPWVIITLLIQGFALVVLIISVRQTGVASFLGLQQVFLPEDISPPRLVTDGLYKYVRHPIYSSGLVILWLIPFLTWNLLALMIGLTVYIFIGAHFEERKLLKEFGEAYAEYRRRTPMLVPGLRLPLRERHS